MPYLSRMPGAGWAVYVEPNELDLGGGRRWPQRSVIGTINQRGTIRVSYPSAGAPRSWGAIARTRLEDARMQLWESGALRNRPAERARHAEEETGSFIVRLSDGRTSRFHSMRSEMTAHGTARGAYDWADRELQKPGVRWAEFYRALPPGATPREGMPWTEPFEVLEKDAHGRIQRGRLSKRDPGRRRSRRDGAEVFPRRRRSY